jgi:hypothetical protein
MLLWIVQLLCHCFYRCNGHHGCSTSLCNNCAATGNAAQAPHFCASFSFPCKLLISTRSSHCNIFISTTSSFSNGRNISKTFSAAFLYFIASCTLHHHQYHIDSQAFDACICHHHCMHHHSFFTLFLFFFTANPHYFSPEPCAKTPQCSCHHAVYFDVSMLLAPML